jgi:peptidyl-prolyl cis-trans isomerase SDCCAG10
MFGRVMGDSLFNLLKLNEVELEPGTSDKPVYPPTIKSVEVRVDPYEDTNEPIVPRITAAERKEQEKAKREMRAERAKQKTQGKRKGTKCVALSSLSPLASPSCYDASPFSPC